MIRVLQKALVLVALIVLTIAVPARAQGTFAVTVASKTADHPWFGQGWGEGYVIDGDQGAVITLVRGQTYVFQLQNVSTSHPFYISTNSNGGGAGVFNDGVQNNFATGNETLTFTVPDTAPDQLFYQCSFHPLMGGVINVVSGGTAAEREELPDAIRLDQNYPNPFNPSTQIAFTLESSQEITLSVFDALGREIRTLASGTYPAGTHSITWDGTTADGAEAPSGSYLYRLETPDAAVTRTMTLVR
ncbi:MAG TPA: FlgD immunoglobulin-like domain containing protein [Rhodothermales bacterium]